MPATMTKRSGSKRGRKPAVSMIHGSGKNRITLYNCSAIEAALAGSGTIRVLRGGKEVIAPARLVHRQDLTGVYGAISDYAGEGKYIVQSAINRSGDSMTVTGAHNVNPFLADDRSYSSIIAAFHRAAGDNIKSLVADVKTSKSDGEHLVWRGKANVDDAVYVTPWLSRDRLLELAQKVNDDLLKNLKSSASPKSGVDDDARLNSKDKFFQNVDVLRRSRRTFKLVSGEIELGGGATPCSMPLEQCGFAIDMVYMTTGFDAQGREIGEPMYRLAYGRSTPWTLGKRDWAGCTTDNKFAYLNEDVRQKAIKLNNRVVSE